MRRSAVLALVIAGCASAGSGGGGGGENQDGPGLPEIDSPPPIDAAITTVLSQTGSTNVVATGIACQNSSTGFTNENSYYRVFRLAEHGITSDFHVTEVTFAVERAQAGSGGAQPAQVRLGTYGGAIDATSFPTTALTQLASATIQIPDGAPTVTVPISMFTPSAVRLAPNANLYAEVFIPNSQAAPVTNHTFYIGSNAGTETHLSYIRGPACSVGNPAQPITNPTSYAAVVPSPAIRLLLTVTGVH
ncbi:MAG: hypothetical protein KF773_35010 [Deltaproteobacteria bacterium]|nr:hypothetical protein [Deltaproteobacteria bacterium]MCW5806646.1 hypothetical protein [Deltaproteobacteria bacterium]